MLLGVNIDHVATLRNARGGFEPDVVQAALICEKAGCDGITTHLREDRRHIKDADLLNLKKVLKTRLNLEMAATDEMQKIALEIMPECCCIVPEKRQEVTTEGGLDVYGQQDKMITFVKPLVDAGIQVSLFIDPDIKQIEAAAKTDAQFIELHTGRYSEARTPNEVEHEFQCLKEATKRAQELGLKVNAGHGLNYENVSKMHEISGLVELNIGHTIISKSVFTGLDSAVKEMLKLVR